MGGSAAIRFRAAGCALLLAHIALVAYVTLRPRDVMWVTAPNLTPLAGVRADLALGWFEAAHRIGQGLVLLAPLGFLLPLVGGRLDVSPVASLLRTTAATALVSLGIALLQTSVPGQVADVDSLLLNTAGAAFTHIAVVPAGRSALRRRQGREGAVPAAAQGRTPTIPRVGIAP
ncbi:VanZ family protein [Streptomyces crystallinus]|uniref:VanZ family protein n=1 Tax=Streptomyces crystallinus TaxID=68191 RepID=A0ABP3Q9V1_9ACTN